MVEISGKSIAHVSGVAGFIALIAQIGKGHTDPFFPKFSILQSTAGLAVGIQLAGFLPSYLFQTERFYDLTGAATYCICVGYSLLAGKTANNGEMSSKAQLVSLLTIAWAFRLGTFLFTRILRDGNDKRFDKIKPNFGFLLTAWVVQALWVFLTALPVFIVNSSQGLTTASFSPISISGLCTWMLGFVIEVIADNQKRSWRASSTKRNAFIDVGLWYFSRHPNYFGEITLWTGMYFICLESLKGKQHIAAMSPFFVYYLLKYISGVKLLEAASDKKFAHLEEYWKYKETTSCIIPLPKGFGTRKIKKQQ